MKRTQRRPKPTAMHPAAIGRTALLMLKNSPGKRAFHRTEASMTVDKLQKFCRHEIQPAHCCPFMPNSLGVLRKTFRSPSPPPAPPVSVSGLGSGVPVRMTQSLNNLPYHSAKTKTTPGSACPQLSFRASVAGDRSVKPFTPSARQRLNISVNNSRDDAEWINTGSSVSVMSGRAVSRFVCDRQVASETRFFKYMTHANQCSPRRTQSLLDDEDEEIVMGGGFRLTAGYVKAPSSLPVLCNTRYH